MAGGSLVSERCVSRVQLESLLPARVQIAVDLENIKIDGGNHLITEAGGRGRVKSIKWVGTLWMHSS